jgi:hypothetical protein
MTAVPSQFGARLVVMGGETEVPLCISFLYLPPFPGIPGFCFTVMAELQIPPINFLWPHRPLLNFQRVFRMVSGIETAYLITHLQLPYSS